jgi:CrcB protein
MPPLSAFVAVAAGAVLGAWLRWFLVGEFNALLPHLPLGTLIANIGGGLMVGFAVAFLVSSPQLHPNVRLFVVTGFLGGLTTFSTFSAEVVELLMRGDWAAGALLAFAHLAGSLLLTFAGFATFRWLAA